MALITRRSLVTGLLGLVAAPAIVRASSLMPVKAWADAAIADEIYTVTGTYSGGITIEMLREAQRILGNNDIDEDQMISVYTPSHGFKVGDLITLSSRRI